MGGLRLWLGAAGLLTLLCFGGCVSSRVPTSRPPAPTAAGDTEPRPSAMLQSTATALLATASSWPTVLPTLSATPMPSATQKAERDAFSIGDFPWADASRQAYPRATGEGKAKVVNSVFFDDPRFFGFDLQTSSGWYHVSGADYWATADGQRISPILLPNLRPRDGDTVVVYGTADDQSVTASFVGYADGTAWYYRSLLSAAEVLSGKLPSVYDGLQVWVRGTLSRNDGASDFYTLPQGTRLNVKYAGQEALLGGRLQVTGGKARLQVTQGIYILDHGKYVKILASAPSEPRTMQEQGIIQTVEDSRGRMSLQRTDGSMLHVVLTAATRLQFADGSAATLRELLPGRQVSLTGTEAAASSLTASRISIISATVRGPAHAAFLAGPNLDLWSIKLGTQGQDSVRRQITHLAAPEAGLANAIFSPDGSRFVFARTDDIGSMLVLGDAGSGELRELLDDDEWQECDPNWSPEGSRIVFCRYRAEGQDRADAGLWVLDWNRGTLRRLRGESPAGWLSVAPRWSPDGRYIAYGQAAASGAHFSNLFVLTLPSDSRQVLEYASEWRWSADSTQLFCTRQAPDEARARLWVVQKDGTSPTWLSPTKGIHDHNGRLSPDGSAIAFLTRPAGSNPPENLGIMQFDGTRRVQVEEHPLASRLAWAPDSQSIVFQRVNRDGESQGLWSVTRGGSGLRALVIDAFAFVATYREPD